MTPINGISDIVRLPRLGKIHLGVKEVSPKTHNPYPRAVDYLVCPEEVQKVFGEKPRELRIMLPVEEDEVFAPQYYKCYSMTRGLICRGDGKTALRLVDLATGALATRDSLGTELREMTCPGQECQEYQAKQCRRVMNLQFLLPEVPGLGVWQIDTSSFYSIVNINSGVKLVRSVCGRVRMVPLVLSLVPQEVSAEGKRKTIHVLRLTSRATLADILKAAPLSSAPVLMPAPDTEAPEDLFPEAQEETEAPVASPFPPLKEAPGKAFSPPSASGGTPPTKNVPGEVRPPEALGASPEVDHASLPGVEGKPSFNYTRFWAWCETKGFPPPLVSKTLGVNTLRDWVSAGRTEEEAKALLEKGRVNV